MKNLIVACLIVVGGLISSYAQSITGKWKTIDDSTGKEKSVVEIYEKNGKYYGKIIELINPSKPNPTCDNCSGDEKGKPIEGMVIIKNMKKDGSSYSGGTITDPQSGKQYKCLIKTNGTDKLDVRGYIGISLVGRTQTWLKAK